MRDVFKSVLRVEAGGELVGKAFVMDEAARAGRANSPLVQVHSLAVAAFDASDFRANERDAILEILQTMLRPDRQLLVARSQRLKARGVQASDAACDKAL